jgi:glutamate dehydrogenase/leucine dehydrogenase
MGKSNDELRAISEGGLTKCDFEGHNFIAETTDTEAIRKHFEEYNHTVTGKAPCVRCGKDVQVKGLKKPAEGVAPGAFCVDCKEELKKELFPDE